MGLRGTLPDGLSALSQLQTFDAFGCNLTGTLPSGLGHMSALTQLRVSQNAMFGTLPPSLSQLTNLLYDCLLSTDECPQSSP